MCFLYLFTYYFRKNMSYTTTNDLIWFVDLDNFIL